MSEIWQLSATELAHRIARRDLSSAEVVDAHLSRIDAVNPALNAVVRVLADEARAGAALADRQLAAGEKVGPLHGVPFTVKENIDMAGLPTTWGVPALAQAVAPADAPVVERMRAAGAIPIGRTNLPDMALRLHTVSSLHGLTRNPWHPGRTAGGSSGGEAAALASGMSPIGLGNDIGGSLRNPANACGIASIRPSAGRWCGRSAWRCWPSHPVAAPIQKWRRPCDVQRRRWPTPAMPWKKPARRATKTR
jgi:amidase